MKRMVTSKRNSSHNKSSSLSVIPSLRTGRDDKKSFDKRRSAGNIKLIETYEANDKEVGSENNEPLHPF